MKIYGHRGARGEAPENTLPSFLHAYKHGIRYFELDLYLSKDHRLVVIHDETVDRTTGKSGKISDFTARELAEMDARKTKAWPAICPVPELHNVVNACPEVMHWQFEVKTDDKNRLRLLCKILINYIQQHSLENKVTITSADTWFLQEVRRTNKTISTGYVAEFRFPEPVSKAKTIGANFLILNWKLCSTKMLETAKQQGLEVSTWTVNRIDDMRKLQSMGIDSIITDYPTSALTHFEKQS
ncbi:MAG: glycerophosphodiester phosphodiesterase [Hahellaceae bacterium]|nr:glycerophosphodiester phosphodiesterase [Hahellaceae bacterium]